MKDYPNTMKVDDVEYIRADKVKTKAEPLEGMPLLDKKMVPSKRINKISDETLYDYRDACGANNCECYENSVKIDAIIQYLDEQHK